MKTHLFRATALGGLVGAAALLAGASSAHAQAIASDRPAGFLVFPKIVSDPLDAFNRGQTTETVIQLTNTDNNNVRAVHCFYVNATGVCLSGTNSIGGVDCRSNADCDPGICNTDVWTETNFTIQLTAEQPTGWLASEPRDVNIVNGEDGGVGDGRILAVPTDYFQGELKCVEVADAAQALPINRNDLKGEATTYVVTRDPNDPNAITSVDVRRYNAIGVPALGPTDEVQTDRTLCLGGNGITDNICETAEYAGCPEKLIVNHLFQGALPNEIDADPSLTLVPCTEQLLEDPTSVTVQILVFNEFEQRFSLSTRVECYRDIRLRDLSILYSVGTQGTLAGQSVVRGVSDGSPETGGFGLLGIAEQAGISGSTAYNIVYSGERASSADFVTYVFTNQ